MAPAQCWSVSTLVRTAFLPELLEQGQVRGAYKLIST